MELAEILKVYGPMALGWIGFGYIGKFVLDRYDRDIDSRVKLASSLDALANVIDRKMGGGNA